MERREFKLDKKGHLDDILINPDLDNVLAAAWSSERLDVTKVEEIAARLIEKAKGSGGSASEKVEITASAAPTPFTHVMNVRSDDQPWIVAHEFMQQIDSKYGEPQVKWLEYLKRCIEAGHALVYTRTKYDTTEAIVQKMKGLSQAVSRATGKQDFPVIDVGSKVEVKESSNIADVVAQWPH